MKVHELISMLKEFDPNLRVVVDGYEGGVKDAGYVTEETIALNVHEEWYYGEHETLHPFEEPNKKYAGHERAQAVHIC